MQKALIDNSPLPSGFLDAQPELSQLIDVPISKLPDAEDLLVFPHSFRDIKDDIDKLSVLTRFNGDVWTTNLMGFFSINGQEVKIGSRFDTNDQDFFLHHLLQKTLHLNIFNMEYSTGGFKAFDFYMLLFPHLLNEALSQGLYKEYRKYNYNDARVRGVIDVNRFIREDVPFQGKVAYRTREFSFDNKVTQLVRHTIEFMRNHPFGHGILNNDVDTRVGVSQIISATPSYCSRNRSQVIRDNLRPVNHPFYTKYRALQQLCVKILRHDGINYGNKKDKIHGILFDGAWLWEEYVASLVKEWFIHYTSDNSHFSLFNEISQKIIPDYLSLSGNEEHGYKAVADAKYMYLHGGILEGERASAVYYKTIMYMYRFKSDIGFLFHPEPSEADESLMESNDEIPRQIDLTIPPGDGRKLHVMGLKIPRYGEKTSFSDFQEKMGKCEGEFQEKIGELIQY